MTKELKEALTCIYAEEADEKAVFQFLSAGEKYDPNVSLYQKYKWAFWAGLSLAAIQQLSGMIIVSFYAPQVFAKQGDSQAQILSLVVALINFAATFVAIYISDSNLSS
jgi:cytochrome b subunit of formate dehydrogenase